MQSLLSKASTITYKKVVKPILFTQKPDAVHERLRKAGGHLQRVRAIRMLLRSTWSYKNLPRLEQTILGIHFRNPVGISAGFDKNFELAPLLKSIGFGFMEGGSLTYESCAGNPKPWFHRLPKTQSLVVHAGLGNQGVVRIVDRIKKYPRSTFTNFPLNISVAKTNSQSAANESDAIADYIGSLKHIKQARVGDMITLNISCPNTYGGEPFTTPARLENLLKSVDKVVLDQPIFIKMPADLDWADFDALLAVSYTHLTLP